MSDAFDPYYKWLGIPPQNQPPDLYRLLSLERFEPDLEVIEAAASRQMNYVQGCATGPHVEHSQRLLNEIAAARLCLLDVQKKAEYDALLRGKLPPAAPPAPPPIAAPVATSARPHVEPALTDTFSGGELTQTVRAAPPRSKSALPVTLDPAAGKRATTARRERPKRPAMPLMPVILSVSLGAVVVVAVALAISGRLGGSSGDTPAVAAKPATTSSGAPLANVATTGAATTGNGTPKKTRRTKELTPQELADAVRATEQEANKTPPAVPALPPDPPVETPKPTTPAAPANEGDPLKAAEAAINRNDVDAARVALMKILDHPGSPNQEQAAKLWVELGMVSDDRWGKRVLSELDEAKFAAYSQGRIEFDFPDIFPGLIPIARQTLRRNLPAEQQRRQAKAQPPGAPAAPPAVPESPPMKPQPPDVAAKPPAAPPAVLPSDPRELLEAMGLKRSFSTWIHADEARCLELVTQAQANEKTQHDADVNLRKSASRLAAAKRAAEQAEKAKQRATDDDDPATGTPAREKIDDRAAQAATELASAEEESTQVRKQADDMKEQTTAAWAEARQLAAGINEKYTRLAKDPRVIEALKQMGQQLGPSDDFKAVRGQLGKGPREKAGQ
ncbi:MAG: hypothetical protein K8T25_02995 [Planctomycetia bacterium]|nr:hypothetical protein [Planctomycetia bacterium]